MPVRSRGLPLTYSTRDSVTRNGLSGLRARSDSANTSCGVGRSPINWAVAADVQTMAAAKDVKAMSAVADDLLAIDGPLHVTERVYHWHASRAIGWDQRREC